MHLYYRAFRLFYGSKLLHNIGRRSFNNYVGILLPFLDHRPTSIWTFYALNLDKNGHVWSTYPPYFVHVIIESEVYWMPPCHIAALFKFPFQNSSFKSIGISPFGFSYRNQIEKLICKNNLACPKSFRWNVIVRD